MVVCIFNKAPETGGTELTISGLAASHVLDLSRVGVTSLRTSEWEAMV